MKHSGTNKKKIELVVLALELIVVEGLLVLVLACLGFAYFSGLKVFYSAGFIVLMLTGLFVFTNSGIITNHYYNEEGVYSSTVLPVSEGIGFVFASLCLYGGIVLTIWVALLSSILQDNGRVDRAFVWN